MIKLELCLIMGNLWEEMFYVDLEVYIDFDEM